MKKTLLLLAALLMAAAMSQAKTLVVCYSYTNTCKTTVDYLVTKIKADVVTVTPSESLCYECNNYAIGMQELNAINANPGQESSYPSINTSISNLADYTDIVIATPLWWSQMAAPMQTLLFKQGKEMAGKNIFMIVASASSGISGVVSRAKELIPGGKFIEPSLHIYSSDVSGTSYQTKVDQWLRDTNFETVTAISDVRADAAAIDEAYYTLQGARVSNPQPGSICIKAGKKVVVK